MSSANLSNKQLAALALFQLGAAERAIDTEDLAMKVAELAPGRFRWKKHPEQIDLEAVRLSVKNLLRDKPAFVTGSMRNGWMLTPAGLSWCARMSGQQRAVGPDHGTDGAVLLRQTDAYRKFEQEKGEEITVHDVRRFLRVDEYTSTRRRKERVQAVINTAHDDQQLSTLVRYLQANFPKEWT